MTKATYGRPERTDDERLHKNTDPSNMPTSEMACGLFEFTKRNCSSQYGPTALRKIKAADADCRLANKVVFVFSDDIAFARANLPEAIDAVFVEHNDAATAHEDLRLMAACRHHIIANSSFSWWGAWLNGRADKRVIAPKQWLMTASSYFPDLMPPAWDLLDVA